VVDGYAAEHLEIQTSNARVWAGRVRNAGAIFVGPYSPVSLGDYCAGSNHVLPTGGCACHSSGLSVQSFLKGIHIVEYNEPALAEVAQHVVTLANAEDLPAHGEAVLARRQPEPAYAPEPTYTPEPAYTPETTDSAERRRIRVRPRAADTPAAEQPSRPRSPTSPWRLK
jgi:hypothetical protein